MALFRRDPDKEQAKAARREERREIRLARARLKASKAQAALNEAERRVRGLSRTAMTSSGQVVHADRHAHASPSHHVGSCDAACRAGERNHAHRRT